MTVRERETHRPADSPIDKHTDVSAEGIQENKQVAIPVDTLIDVLTVRWTDWRTGNRRTERHVGMPKVEQTR